MANIDTATGKTKKARVSVRGFIDEAGNPVDKIEQAAGASFGVLGDDEKTVIHEFKQYFNVLTRWVTMNAIFGFQTKAGNVANTVLNDKDEPGGPAEAVEAIQAWIDGASDPDEPVWAERAGGVGARVDRDALAQAASDVNAEFNKANLGGRADRETDVAVIRAKMESDATLVKKMRQVPEYQKRYSELVGKARNVDELF